MTTDERLLLEVRERLAAAGLHASIVVRDLLDGRELALDPDVVWPLASVAKLALATAVLQASARGAVDPAAGVLLLPGPSGVSPGTDRFRHAATIAVDDLLSLAVTVSDNRAADALLELLPPDAVRDELEALGVTGLIVRHPFRELGRTPAERLGRADRHLAHALAIRGAAPAAGHPVPQLDVARTNVGSARALTALLAEIWTGDRLAPGVAGRLRGLLADNVVRQRLAPDLSSDTMTWSSKTGTLLHLRHEAGVVQHADGEQYGVVVLSRSDVPAGAQPGAEAALGAAARALHDRLRSG